MRVFVTGGTGHSGSYIIPELIAAGHEVTGLARSDTAAAAVSALGAKVRRGSLEDLDGLKEAAAYSDGVIHVAHRQDLLPSGGMDAVAAAELLVMLAYGDALAGTGKPLVAAGSIGSAGNLGRPATEEDPALPSGDEHKGTLRVRNVVETAVVGLAERGVRSSIVRLPLIAHSTTDSAGFLPGLIALAQDKGFAGYPGDGMNVWNAVHIRDAALLFRLALEKGPAGRYWHASEDGGIPFRDIAEAIGSRSGPARRERSRGRTDAAGILRDVHESGHAGPPSDQPHHAPDPGLGTHAAQTARRFGQRPLLLRSTRMTTFAPHRDTVESFVDCINGGADEDTLTRLLAEDVVLYGPFGDEPVTGREAAVETIKTVNGLSSDDSYMEVLSGENHHAAHFRLQVGDAAVNGIFFVLLDADGKIAEVSIFYRTLPAGVALQRNLADVIGMQPWELRTGE